ncbi:MAG: hypothetical protein HY928_07030 [Elusimicrobia bacterium]|nr:hypothetical protein [Elusimicrobiota bacterium]
MRFSAGFFALFLAAPAAASPESAADSLLKAVSPAISSGSAVFIGEVEDTTGRSAPAAAALRAHLQRGVLSAAQGWVLHDPAPEGAHLVLLGRIVDDGSGLQAFLFVRRSPGTEVLAGASAALDAGTPHERSTPAVEPAVAPATAPVVGWGVRWKVKRLWDGDKSGTGRRFGAFGGAIFRTESSNSSVLIGATLRSPSGRFELVADGGRFKLSRFEENRDGVFTYFRQRETKATFLRLRPVLRAVLGRLPWCGFDRCPEAALDGGLGLAYFRFDARTTNRVQSALGGVVSNRPDQEGTFQRVVPFAAAGVTLAFNRRLELGLQGDYVWDGESVNSHPYGGAALGARLTLFFP